jgi:hypothetical protein
MSSYDRALPALRFWLDSWSGIGRIAVGMARQAFDLQLTRYDESGWRATFYTTGMEHSPHECDGHRESTDEKLLGGVDSVGPFAIRRAVGLAGAPARSDRGSGGASPRTPGP